jgi:hypothetical protein
LNICFLLRFSSSFFLMIRLKYLLSQSDIFSHFGAVRSGVSSDASAAGKPGVSGGGTSANGGGSNRSSKLTTRRSAATLDELDEDERAMVDEAVDDDEAGGGGTHPHGQHHSSASTVLTAQPECISGGQMRYGLCKF